MKKCTSKRLLCLALSLLTAMTVTACGGNEDKTDSASEEAASLTLTREELPIIDGALALAPYYEAMTAKLLNVDICNNTPSAYQNLTDGTVDMIFCAMPSDEQVNTAKQAGVTFEYHTILNGGFVFFVNKDNPLKSLPKKQLQDIYREKIKNWKELAATTWRSSPISATKAPAARQGFTASCCPRSKS